MAEQKEKSDSRLLPKLRALAEATGGYCSGQLIENFREGWAMEIFAGRRVHYWTRDGFEFVESRCRLVALVRDMYGAGNWPRCKRCARMAPK
jgi:hypothetical protein